MIIGLSGLAGVGKDTVADILVKEHGFVKIGLADELKRIVRDVFNFTNEQLWGPSTARNEPDLRYPRQHTWDSEGPIVKKCLCCGIDFQDCMEAEGTAKCHLSPRYALQKLGTEWGRDCYTTVWSEYTLRVARGILLEHRSYAMTHGIGVNIFANQVQGQKPPVPFAGVVIPDVRFKSELEVLKQADRLETAMLERRLEQWHDTPGDAKLHSFLGMTEAEYNRWVTTGLHRLSVRLVRLRRPGFEKAAYAHTSETEQLEIPDSEFDYLLNGGDEGVAGLDGKVQRMLAHMHKEEWRT